MIFYYIFMLKNAFEFIFVVEIILNAIPKVKKINKNILPISKKKCP